MKMEHHIANLLYRYQCVVVPGFGAFLTEIQSAQFHADTNVFSPPKKRISFNAHLKNNDGLLATHIATQEKVSYEKAVAVISEEVTLWISQLQRRESILLKNIGEISVNTELNWVFEPTQTVNFLTDSFGLSHVVSSVVKRETTLPTPVNVANTTEEKEEEEETPMVVLSKQRSNFNFFKYAAVFGIMMGVGGTAFKLYQDDKTMRETLLAEQKIQEKVQHKIQEATFVLQNPFPAITTLADSVSVSKPYHVVAGSFRNEENAARAYNELKAKGFNAVRLAPNQFGLYPVLYGSFSSYATAQEKMKEIHKKLDKEAWVLIKEL